MVCVVRLGNCLPLPSHIQPKKWDKVFSLVHCKRNDLTICKPGRFHKSFYLNGYLVSKYHHPNITPKNLPGLIP